MKHIRTFESYRVKKHREEIIKESVLQVNDIYKVKTMVDIPQSLINAYVKKVKDNTGKNLRQFFGDVDIAEEIVKYITINNVDVEKIPGNALMGGAQAQGQEQVQVDAETDDKEEQKAQVSEEEVKEEEPKDEEFEEPKAQVAEEEKEEEKAEGEEEKAEGEEKPESEEEKAEGEEKPESEELPL